MITIPIAIAEPKVDRIQIVEPEVRLYKQGNPLAKIEYMARICTGSEDKADPARPNMNLIKFCINAEHESILEHFRIDMNIFIADIPDFKFTEELKNKKILDIPEGEEDKYVNMRTPRCICPDDTQEADIAALYELAAMMKFDRGFLQFDHRVEGLFDDKVGYHRLSVSLLGNVRAWRDGLKSLLEIYKAPNFEPSNSSVIPMMNRIIHELYHWMPIFFEDIIEDIKSFDPGEYPGQFRPFIVEAQDYTSYIIDTDRNVTHQYVRHRDGCSYSQQSQRYCRYKGSVKFTKPVGFKWAEDGNEDYELWKTDMQVSADNYLRQLDRGMKAEEARLWLSGSCHTRIGVTLLNEAEEHFLGLRLDEKAYAPVRHIAQLMVAAKRSNASRGITNMPKIEDIVPQGQEIDMEAIQESLGKLMGLTPEQAKDLDFCKRDAEQ